ncbi:SUN domain-containing protein 1 isoform X6 [Tympanuchus pallidicinctus]|uniref:SUN domain-containing protein 1 isoform X6 n=1 Tax=Tympanuchus pallidicinctus TaxID=109042 RepID=UPI0022871F9E|nr:SUN domain-containing protein 1 isoform X6 [Tympanuchus pallidicinctus]
MDFSRLHTYTPPQCVPENTGYTYALSSSYSSDALDFEIEHKIDPVFDSPRMSRRSLRLAALGVNKPDSARNDILHDSSYSGSVTFREQSSNMVKQRKSINKQSGSVRDMPRKHLSSSPVFNQSSFLSRASDTSMVSTVLDESSIREQTEVDHFWGLDDDGDPKGSDATLLQRNGDIATAETQTTMINGYTCSDCSMLSERKEVLTAYSAAPGPSSRIYSRDRSQKHASTHSDYCGSMNIKEFYREDSRFGVSEESICDDCKGKKQLEIHTTEHMQSSRAKRVARTISHIFSYAGYFVLHVLRTVGAAGWFVSQKVLALLWLAILSPGRAASGIFRLLRAGWNQLLALMSLLKVFILRKCLPKVSRLLLFLIPLLFLLGLWFWGFDSFVALLPLLNRTRIDKVQSTDDSVYVPGPQPDSSRSVQPPKDTINIFDSARINELEKQMAFVSDRCHHHDEEYSKVLLLLHNLQDQVAQMGDRNEILKLIRNVMDQHLKDKRVEEKVTTDFLALHQEHNLRIVTLEDLLRKLSAEFKDIQKEIEIAKAKAIRDGDEHNQLLSRVKKLELELSQVKSELSTGESVKTSYEKIDVIHEKVDAQVKESVKMMVFGDQHKDFPESLLQWLTSNFVTRSDLQTLLQDLELQILKNITLQMAVTNQRITSEVVTNAVNNAGISGITEAQAQIIVNNALKLYSQDKTGMVDFALESGGGSILSTRCSETYETKTALISLFGIPLWYFSQSPRVVIQPDMYPGNCWAFKGSEGYLVVRLSMKIYPTAFSLEHIPKTLSPSGNITSAPRKFSVYGLDDEYQEEGTFLGQYVYDQEGEPLQMFTVEKSENVFQIVELRILSNWGHAEYTCLYRFRVHGKPAE